MTSPSVTIALATTNPILNSKPHVSANLTLSGSHGEGKYKPSCKRQREDCSWSSLFGLERSFQDILVATLECPYQDILVTTLEDLSDILP